MMGRVVLSRWGLAAVIAVLAAGPWLTGVQGAETDGGSRSVAVSVDPDRVPKGRPNASVDLGTDEGVQLVRGAWRYADAKVVEVPFRAVGPDNKPTGVPNMTYTIEPKAGVAGFDDSAWSVLPPTQLAARKSNGLVSFAWYRLNVTVPERVGGFDPTGSTVVFEITVDDYAEVWVDGELPRTVGARNTNLIQGWNQPNRLVVAEGVRPGQRIQLAVFGVNGPLSDPPMNYIWVRGARLEFYREPRAIRPTEVPLEVVKLDAGLDAVIGKGAKLQKLAEGFQFTEGPAWRKVDQSLLFSDPNANRIYRWSEADGLSVFREQSGYAGGDIAEYRQPGSNGLAFDASGRLTIAEHGNRRVSRLGQDGAVDVVADRFDGKRLNSPNDLVYRSDGSLYFTDPPFGLPRFADDPRREQPHFGVYRAAGGRVDLVSAELEGPNGLAFSPDERFLYVGNWADHRKVVLRYPVQPDGTLGRGEVFLDLTAEAGEEAIDGVKVDRAGNVFVSGPGGLWIIAPDGRRLGVLRGPEPAHNFAWGGADGRTLYLTARTGLYRLNVLTGGGT